MNQNENIYKPDSNLQDEEAKTDFNKIEEKTVKNDVDKISNAWGIGYLEYPVGDIINYIYKKTKINPTKMNKYVIKRNKNKINFEDESIFDKLKIDNLSEEELAKTDFIFLECFARSNEDLSEGDEEDTGNNNENQEKNNNNNQNPINQEKEESKNNIENKENTKDNNNNKNNSEKKSNENDAQNNESKKEEENNNNEENAESEESTALSDQQNLTLPYQYFESQYLMEFDQKFIYLKNIYQIEELDKNILPLQISSKLKITEKKITKMQTIIKMKKIKIMKIMIMIKAKNKTKKKKKEKIIKKIKIKKITKIRKIMPIKIIIITTKQQIMKIKKAM